MKAKKIKKKSRGQPTKFDSGDIKLMRDLIKQGKTDEELMERVNEQRVESGQKPASLRTLYNWKKANPEFFQTIKCWKEKADAVVEASLFERAKGYEYQEDMIIPTVGVETVNKHMPGNVAAQIFWLKNRRAQHWRDKNDIELTSIKKLSDAELEEIAKKVMSEDED